MTHNDSDDTTFVTNFTPANQSSNTVYFSLMTLTLYLVDPDKLRYKILIICVYELDVSRFNIY